MFVSRAGLAGSAGRLPGGPVSVRAALATTVAVAFKFTLDCRVPNILIRKTNIPFIPRIYNYTIYLKAYTYQWSFKKKKKSNIFILSYRH